MAQHRKTVKRKNSPKKAGSRGKLLQRKIIVRGRKNGKNVRSARSLKSPKKVLRVKQNAKKMNVAHRRMPKQNIVQQPHIKQPLEQEIGHIEHYFTHLSVGVVEIAKGELNVGDKIHIKGETTDIIQIVKSMQNDHAQVQRASAGQSIGLKVDDRVRQHDKVFLIE
ncbi:MAG: hypothetical protein AABW64_03990 [Nanoarchaeota archaeon]